MRDEMDDDYDLSAPENAILLLCLQYEQLVELFGPSLPPRRTRHLVAKVLPRSHWKEEKRTQDQAQRPITCKKILKRFKLLQFTNLNFILMFSKKRVLQHVRIEQGFYV